MFILLNRYRNIIAFLCFCIVSLILSWYSVGAAHTAGSDNDSLKHKVSLFLAPVYLCSSAVSSAWAKVTHAGSASVSVWQKPIDKARLLELENEVEGLERQLNAEKEDNRRRLAELQEVCDSLSGGEIESESVYKLAPAKVIAVEPTDWFRYLTIDKGRNDGVREDMAVITRSNMTTQSDMADGVKHLVGAVVGKVVEVQGGSARVQLITDRMSDISVTIGTQGDLVLLSGQPDTENCSADAIPSTAHDMLRKGHVVVVDERSPIYPRGMLVGRISSIEKGTHFCRIEVQPAFKFSKLREVMVVLDAGD